MSFKVVGKGIFTKDTLQEKLAEWGIKNPLAVIKQAETGRAMIGDIRILAIK